MVARSTGAWLLGCMLDALVAAALACFPLAVLAADAPGAAAAPTANPDAFFAAIVRIEARSLPDARSNATLPAEREGSGIVIGKDGLVLTIGYLLIEADEVRIIDGHDRELPARVVAYDHVSGLGLVRAITPLDAAPLPLGDSSKLAEAAPVLIVSAGGSGQRASVVSRRLFTANWEYMLDSAIFTSPPTLDWSGAALIGPDGALLGVGSLIVRDATQSDPSLPGNMFVPIDTLKPILADLIRTGRRAGPARPWLGLGAEEVQGRLIVVRVAPESPAERAGVRTGDIILAVGGDEVRSQPDFYRKIWSRGAAGSEIPLRVLHGIDVHDLKVQSIDRVDYFRKKPST